VTERRSERTHNDKFIVGKICTSSHMKQLLAVYSRNNKFQNIAWAKIVVYMREKKCACGILVGKKKERYNIEGYALTKIGIKLGKVRTGLI